MGYQIGYTTERIKMYNDLVDNYLSKNFKFHDLESLLGKTHYKRVYNRILYKETCNQYYMTSDAGVTSVGVYMIVCPDKNNEYVGKVYLIPRYSIWFNFDFGEVVKVD